MLRDAEEGLNVMWWDVMRCVGRREKTTVDSRPPCRYSIWLMTGSFRMSWTRIGSYWDSCASMGRNRQSVCLVHVIRPWVPDWSAICPIASNSCCPLPPSACSTIFHDWTVWYQHLVAKFAVVLPATKPWSIHLNSFNCSNVKEAFQHCDAHWMSCHCSAWRNCPRNNFQA